MLKISKSFFISSIYTIQNTYIDSTWHKQDSQTASETEKEREREYVSKRANISKDLSFVVFIDLNRVFDHFVGILLGNKNGDNEF